MTILFFFLFSWFMVTAKTRRQVVVVTLVGTVGAAVVAPAPVMAQVSLTEVIHAVLNVINGVINTALNSIQTVRTSVSNLYQSVIWPVNAINLAKAQVTQMAGKYRGLMRGIFNIDLKSATVAATQRLEAAMRSPQTADFNTLTTSYQTAYGPIPMPTAASPEDRAMADMDDALTLDNLKTLKATDAADILTLQVADQLEDAASQAAPGSAPFLTAAAVAASIQTQAVTQQMLAAELRQEAAQLAHENTLNKRGAIFTKQVGTQIDNLLNRK